MITEAMIPEIKKVVTDFNNPIFQRYLKSEMTCHHVCPVCSQKLNDYTGLYLHINKVHKDLKTTESVKNALNPLYRIRQLFDTQQEEKLLTAGQYFAERICSDHNQNVLLNMTAPMGAGKSYSAMRLAEDIAKAVANLKGGDPKQYFNVNNIAVMKLDSIIPIIEDLDNRQYNIIILDDIGSSYSARDFNSVVNKQMNKIFQTFRDTNTCVILTMPALFLIDKVARNIAHFQIEITESRHSQGINIGKLFEIIPMYRQGGKAHFHFVQHKGTKYTKIIFKRPSPEIVSEYDAKRKAIRMEMMAESIDSIKEAVSGCESTGDLEKVPKHIQISAQLRDLLLADPKLSERKLQEMLEVGRDTIRRSKQYLNSNGLL